MSAPQIEPMSARRFDRVWKPRKRLDQMRPARIAAGTLPSNMIQKAIPRCTKKGGNAARNAQLIVNAAAAPAKIAQ